MNEDTKKYVKTKKSNTQSCSINLTLNQLGVSLIGSIDQKTVEFFYINMDQLVLSINKDW